MRWFWQKKREINDNEWTEPHRHNFTEGLYDVKYNGRIYLKKQILNDASYNGFVYIDGLGNPDKASILVRQCETKLQMYKESLQ